MKPCPRQFRGRDGRSSDGTAVGHLTSGKNPASVRLSANTGSRASSNRLRTGFTCSIPQFYSNADGLNNNRPYAMKTTEITCRPPTLSLRTKRVRFAGSALVPSRLKASGNGRRVGTGRELSRARERGARRHRGRHNGQLTSDISLVSDSARPPLRPSRGPGLRPPFRLSFGNRAGRASPSGPEIAFPASPGPVPSCARCVLP